LRGSRDAARSSGSANVNNEFADGKTPWPASGYNTAIRALDRSQAQRLADNRHRDHRRL
jgi:hypothetical protein